MIDALPRQPTFKKFKSDQVILPKTQLRFPESDLLLKNEHSLPIGFKGQDIDYNNSQLPKEKVTGTIEIDINGTIIGEIGDVFNELSNAIEESKYILELEDSWDDEGAKKISKTAYNNAVDFLIMYSNYIYKNFDFVLSTPQINPCVDGTVDLSFRNEKARLLINIQDDESKAIFYGDKFNNILPIKGTVPIDRVYEHLAIWMKELAIDAR